MANIVIKRKELTNLKVEGKKLFITKILKYPKRAHPYGLTSEEYTIEFSLKEMKKIYKFLHKYYNKCT